MIEKLLFRKNDYIWIALGISVICYMLAMLILFNIPAIILLKFIVLNIISIFLPGLVLASLLNIEYTRVGVFCTSYILGYAFIVVEYFLSEIFDRRLPFLAVTILIAVISAVYLVLKIIKGQCIVKFEFPHFLSPHVLQSAILKYSNRLICCDLTFDGRKQLIPERLMDRIRSMPYPMA